jgi:hypothetical protein
VEADIARIAIAVIVFVVATYALDHYAFDGRYYRALDQLTGKMMQRLR